MADFLGKYELRAVLGKGAMGTVYDGFDPLIARQVAIKTVRLPAPDDLEAQDELARFKREAQAAGRLSHPNIVGVFDYGETPEIAYIVMEYVDGTTLKHLTDKKDRFELPEIVRLMTELMAGLQYSHDRGVVHRDIKPANIMLTKKGEVKIADFGIARIESSSMTQAGTMLGTPSYMSPEQFMGQTVDSRTDLYSSGVLLYQLLTGEKPFEGGLTAIMHKVLNTEPPPPSALSVTVPGAFDAVVKKAMAKRPEDRFASATEFAAAIRAAFEAKPAPVLADTGFGLGDFGDGDATLVTTNRTAPPPPARPAAPPPSPPPAPPAARKGPNLALFGGVAAVLLIILAAGAFLLLGHKPQTIATTQSPVVITPPASQTTQPFVPPAQQKPPPPQIQPLSAATMNSVVEKSFEKMDCTLISAAVQDEGQTANVTLTGLVGQPPLAGAISHMLTTYPANFKFDDQIQTINGPYCDAMDAIRPYRTVIGDNGLTLALTGGDRPLHNNEVISVDETLPPGTSFVETDYFQGDGTVYHPPAPKLVPGQTAVTEQIGQVGAPYGTDLMVAITASAPLFTAPRQALEKDSDYLPALTQALQTAAANGTKISVAALPVVTVP
jgi:serine/threonine-protein kinase